MRAKQNPETLAASGVREEDLAGQRVNREHNEIAEFSQEPQTALAAAFKRALEKREARI